MHARPRRPKRGACAQALRASKARGLPLGHWGRSQSQGSSSGAPWHRGSFLAGRRMSASEVKGPEKIARSVLTCPPGSVGSVTWRMVCSRKKKSSACLPHFFASLKPLAAARTLMTWKALSKGHKDSQKGPSSPFSSSIFGRIFCSLIPRDDGLRSLPLRLRGVPTFRDLYCAPLASAIAPASNSRSHSRSFLCSACTRGSTSFLLKKRFCCGTLVENGKAWAAHALAHLQQHDDFTVQPEALMGLAEVACNDTCESRDGCLYFGRL